MSRLPGVPPPFLAEAWEALEPEYQAALLPHITQGTSTEIISRWIRAAAGDRWAVSPRTLRRYRQSLKLEGRV